MNVSNTEMNGKEQQLLSAARRMFWKYGYKKVSVQDICKEAQISKMTFYRFFENKLVIARAVFDAEVSAGVLRFKNLMKEKISPEERINKLVMLKQQGVQDISREFLQDFYTNPELGLKTYIEEKTRATWLEMLNDFKAAQKKGYFRKDLKAEFFFILTQKVTELLNDPKLTALYADPKDLVVEMTRMFAYGISPAKK